MLCGREDVHAAADGECMPEFFPEKLEPLMKLMQVGSSWRGENRGKKEAAEREL